MLVDGEVRGALDIPCLGSMIARNSFTKPVEGLDTIPVADRPPVNLTHLSFQAMVGIGTALALAVVVYWLLRRRGHDLLDEDVRGHRWFLRGAVLAGPLAIVCLEAGWIATEVGRQPWVVYGVLRTAQAAGENSGLWWLYGASLLLYGAMTWGRGRGAALDGAALAGRRGAPAQPVRPRAGRRGDRPGPGCRPMSLELAVVAALFAGVLAYALFGGADFGSGFYDLTAGGDHRGAALRTQIDHSIGPVWEANHVWLIYVLVIWWTGLPRPPSRSR